MDRDRIQSLQGALRAEALNAVKANNCLDGIKKQLASEKIRYLNNRYRGTYIPWNDFGLAESKATMFDDLKCIGFYDVTQSHKISARDAGWDICDIVINGVYMFDPRGVISCHQPSVAQRRILKELTYWFDYTPKLDCRGTYFKLENRLVALIEAGFEWIVAKEKSWKFTFDEIIDDKFTCEDLDFSGALSNAII